MPEPSACRNTSARRATGTRPDSMMSRSTWPGPTDGSWSTSPTSTSVAPGAHRGDQAARQLHVEHRGLVDDEEVGRQRIVVAAPERAARPALALLLRLAPLEQAMHRLRAAPGRFGQPLGGAARRRGEHHAPFGLLPGLHERAHDGGLAGAGSAGDDDDAGLAAAGDGASLPVGEPLGADDGRRLGALGVAQAR